MGRQLWLADVVADAFRGVKGFQVDAVSGWQTRGRTDFYPEGVMNHHTGPGTYPNLLNYMVYGSSIAPLCNIATSRPNNGIVRITICNAGRANHAGVGELPWRKGEGSTGNTRTIGIENQNNGDQEWPSQQVEGIRILTAALLKYLDKTVDRTLDHKTYAPTRKVDRYAVNVVEERQIIDKIMNPAPPPVEEENMPLTEEDIKAIWAYPISNHDGVRADMSLGRAAGHSIEANKKLDEVNARLSRAETLNRGLAAAVVSEIRRQADRPDDPASDNIWVSRLAAGTHTVEQARDALLGPN